MKIKVGRVFKGLSMNYVTHSCVMFDPLPCNAFWHSSVMFDNAMAQSPTPALRCCIIYGGTICASIPKSGAGYYAPFIIILHYSPFFPSPCPPGALRLGSDVQTLIFIWVGKMISMKISWFIPRLFMSLLLNGIRQIWNANLDKSCEWVAALDYSFCGSHVVSRDIVCLALATYFTIVSCLRLEQSVLHHLLEHVKKLVANDWQRLNPGNSGKLCVTRGQSYEKRGACDLQGQVQSAGWGRGKVTSL